MACMHVCPMGISEQGIYLLADAPPPFSLALADRAVMDVPVVGPVWGWFAGLAWRGFETFSQISFRNQVLVSSDWVRTKLFGRDTSRV